MRLVYRKTKLSKFICTCHGDLVSSVAARGKGWAKMAATGAKDQALLHRPPRSPDLTLRNYFYGDTLSTVSLPPLTGDLLELGRRIFAAISEIDRDMLQRVCEEVDYQFDVCRVTKSGQIENVWGTQKKKMDSLSLQLWVSCYRYSIVPTSRHVPGNYA